MFVLYVSNLEDCLKWSSAITYADDSTTGTSDKLLNDLIAKMEYDAEMVLRFMASNSLIANPKKNSLVFLNLKKKLVKKYQLN